MGLDARGKVARLKDASLFFYLKKARKRIPWLVYDNVVK